MKFFGLYITTKDYKASAEFYKNIADDRFYEKEDCKAALRACSAENAELQVSVKSLNSDNLSLVRKLEEISKEKDRIVRRLYACESKLGDDLDSKRKGSSKLKQKFQQTIREYKSEIQELEASCNELASDNILISRRLEHQENSATELAWYKAAISRCKRRCRNASDSPESILKSLFSEVEKYRKR